MVNIKLIITSILSFFLFLLVFNLLFSFSASSEDVFLSKENFLKIAFEDDVPRRKGLRFKGEA